MNSGLSGEPLSKQFSHSLIQPSSLTTYREFFRQNSSTESGFVEVSIDKSEQYVRKWMAFDESVLYFYKDPLAKDQGSFSIPMDKVISFRADNNNPEHPVISIVTIEKSFKIRLSKIDEMRKWVFCFQKSVALVLTHILEGRKKEEGSAEDRAVWLKDLGNGHGHRDRSYRAINRALTMEDVPSNNNYAGFSRNASRMFNDESGSGSPAPKILAVSPAIPIMVPANFQTRGGGRSGVGGGAGSHGADSESAFSRERVASSYRNEDFSPLTEVMRQQPSHHDLNDDDDEDGDDNHSAPPSDDDDDAMFDMDETIEEKASKQTSGGKGSGTSGSSATSGTGVGELLRQSRATTPQSSSSATNSRLATPRGSFSGGPAIVATSSGTLKWDSGVCSKLGARTKNEDKFVALPICHTHNYRATTTTSSFFDGNAPPNHLQQQQHQQAPRGLNVGTGVTKSLLSTSLEASSHKGSYMPTTSETTCGYFAVYDGHAGDLAANFLKEHLHDRIMRHNLFPGELELAVFETFLEIDKEFLEFLRRSHPKSAAGTTALGAFILGSDLTVFNVGDSMAVLCSNGNAVELSDSHKPNRQDENSRILAANGWITEEKELYMGRLHRIDYDEPMAVDKVKNMNWVTIYRVCGELALSRSIGDPDYKGFIPHQKADAFFLWPEGHNQVFKADLVIPDPEFKNHRITSEDEFLILASDGLWDVVSPTEAVKHVQKSFSMNKSPEEVSEELCDLAIRLGSSDNVTIVIVRFIHS